MSECLWVLFKIVHLSFSLPYHFGSLSNTVWWIFSVKRGCPSYPAKIFSAKGSRKNRYFWRKSTTFALLNLFLALFGPFPFLFDLFRALFDAETSLLGVFFGGQISGLSVKGGLRGVSKMHFACPFCKHHRYLKWHFYRVKFQKT